MFCTNCGKELEDTWVKCPYCGTVVESDEDKEQDAQPEVHSNPTENKGDENSSSEYIPKYKMENTGKIKYRSFWKFLLLSCITFGIYGIYVMYGYVKDINKVCEGDGKQSKNYIVVILLSMITCGIYGLYWSYTQGERLYRIAPKYGIQIREKGSSILLWTLLGVVTFGISSLAVSYILFDNLNTIGKIYNGEKSADEINRAGKPHPHLLRNVLIICAVIWVFMIGSIILMVNSFSTYDISDDMDNSLDVEEVKEDYSDVDLEAYFGQPEEMLQELGIEGDEYGEYSALDDTLYISCTDGIVYIIMMEGSDVNMPSFHGVKTGMSLNDADTLLADTYMPAGQMDNRAVYLNMDTGVNVVLETEGEEIKTITVTQLSEEEIANYMQNMYVFPDSDKKYLSEDEVRSVEVDRLALGRNEIFARHGYIFDDDTYKQYFESMPWYEGTVPADQFNADEVFNDFEKKNAELIKKVEDEINGVNQANSFIGMDGWYTCITGSEGITGHINVQANGDGTVNLIFRTLEMSYDILTVQGAVIDDTTIQADYYGYIITMTWSDAENMTITKQGELSGTDSGIIMDITNNQSYLRTTEFNKW